MRLLALAFVLACSSPAKPPPASQPQADVGTRTALLARDDARFEGPTFKNACGGDTDCHVGGCWGEICTAEEGVNSA